MGQFLAKAFGLVAIVGGALAVPVAAGAQEPKFEYGKPEDLKDVKAVEWKASASAGLILSTGNSRSLAFSGSANISRKDGDNKFTLDAAGAFARSELLIAVDSNGNGTIGPDEIIRETQTTTKNWNTKLRYDRFFGDANSAFLAGRIGADEPAGKNLFGGFQLGYSRRLYKDDVHEVIGEIGYDFSYESYAAATPSLAIHSLRAFAGYNAKLTKDTAFLANVEALFNVNSESTSTGDVSAFDDTRLNFKVQLTTKLFERIDFRFSFIAKYDNAPAPLPPFSIPFDAGFIPLADKLDAITEAAIIVSFL